MKKVTIYGMKYLYSKLDNVYILYYDPKGDWVEKVKGKTAFQITDTGNGLEITQNKKNKLDYSEAVELKYLLNKIIK